MPQGENKDLVIERFTSPGLERLIRRLGLVSSETLASLSRSSRPKKIIGTLADEKLLDEHEALQQIAAELGIEYRRLFSSSDHTEDTLVKELDREAAALIDPDFASTYRIIPLGWNDKRIVLAVTDPLDLPTFELAEMRLGHSLELALAAEDEIVAAVSLLLEQPPDFDVEDFENLEALVELADSKLSAEGIQSAPSLRPIAHKIVHHLFTAALEKSSQELDFLCSAGVQVVCKDSKNDSGEEITTLPLLVGAMVVNHLRLCARKNPTNSLSFQTEEGSWEIRVAERGSGSSSELCVQFLESAASFPVLSRFLLPASVESAYKNSLAAGSKVVLLCGPSDSLKTETAYSTLRFLSRGPMPVYVIGDRLDVDLPNVKLFSSGASGSLFKKYLKTIASSPPGNVIFNRAASSTNLEQIFSSFSDEFLLIVPLDAANAGEALDKLRTAGLSNEQISRQIDAILDQRTFKKICSNCSRPLSLEELEKASTLVQQEDFFDTIVDGLDEMRTGDGCEECDSTGYQGLRGLFSYLGMHKELRTLIESGCSLQEFEDKADELAQPSLKESAVKEFLIHGTSTADEYARIFPPPKVAESKGKNTGQQQQPVREEKRPAAKAVKQDSPKNPMQKKKILVVDDDPDVRGIIRMVLEQDFYEVEEATDGYDGLEKVFADPPDLIMCDIAMPRIDGKEFVKRVRNEKGWDSLPIVMFTALDDEDTEVDLLATGADDFVDKTAGPQKIIARVRNLLSKRKT